MIRELTESTKKKFIVINIAYEIGICKAAELFNINRKSIRNWINKYEKGGLDELQNKSRKDQSFENKMPKEIVDIILNLKIMHPEYSARKIKEVLNLNYSIGTIYKKLKANNTIIKVVDETNIDKNSRSNIFSDFFISIKKIKYKNDTFYKKFPKYLILLEERITGISFCSFSNEKTSLSVAIFLEYFIETLRQENLNPTYNFHISSSIKFSSNDLIEKIISKKYKYKIIKNSYYSDFFSRKKENFYKYLFNNLFSELNMNAAINSFSHKVFAHTVLYNFGVIKEQKMIYKVIPIVTDKLISDISQIENNNDYFTSAYSNNLNNEYASRISLVNSAILYLKERGLKLQQKYNYTKAEKYYLSIKSLSKYFANETKNSLIGSTDLIKIKFENIIESLLHAILGLITIYKAKGSINEERSLLIEGIKYSSKYNFHEFKMKLLNKLAHLDVAFQKREKSLKIIKFIIQNTNPQTENCLRAKMLLGNYYKGKDNINIALKIYDHVLDRIKDQYPILKIRILTTIARTYLSINRFEDTKLYCEKAIETSKHYHIDNYDIKIQDHLGIYYSRIGEFENSIKCFKKAVKLSSERNNIVSLNRNTVLLANMYYIQGKYDRAVSSIKAVLPTIQEIKDHETEIRSLQSISKVYLALRKYKIAEEYADKAIFLADYIKDNNQYILSLICKINIHFQKFNLKKIVAINQIFIKMNDRIEYTSTKSIVSLINKRVKALKSDQKHK